MKRYKIIALTALASLVAACTEQESTLTEQRAEKFYTGELDSSSNTYLTPPEFRRMWQYEVKTLLPEGTEVKDGDQVVWFDKSSLQKNMREDANELATLKQEITNEQLSAEKKIEEMKLQLAESKMNAQRAKLKSEINDVSVAKVDQEVYAIEAAIAQDRVDNLQNKISLELLALEQKQTVKKTKYKRKESRVNSQKRGLKALDLKATHDGVVVYIRGHDGEPIKNGSRTYRGQAVARIADLNKMQVTLKIPERDVQHIDFDGAIDISIEADPERIWQGEVMMISDVFLEDDSLVYSEVIIAVQQPDAELMRPGGKARVRLAQRGDS